ncbi:MAG TPA: hypothetical protein VIV60_05580, partial [Polyangiaceae bacterium]
MLRSRLRHWSAILASLGAIAIAEPAAGYEANVETTSVLQMYSVRSPWGAPILSRQRLTHTLSLDAFRPSIPESTVSLAFHARLRLDGD